VGDTPPGLLDFAEQTGALTPLSGDPTFRTALSSTISHGEGYAQSLATWHANLGWVQERLDNIQLVLLPVSIIEAGIVAGVEAGARATIGAGIKAGVKVAATQAATATAVIGGTYLGGQIAKDFGATDNQVNIAVRIASLAWLATTARAQAAARANGPAVTPDVVPQLNDVPVAPNYDPNLVAGANPNGLRQRVVTSPTAGEGGVYLKPEAGRTKVGSTDDFLGRYPANVPNGIEVEIPQTRFGPPQGVDDSAYPWTAGAQRRFDEEYVDRITPANVRYRSANARSSVSQDKWSKFRQIFGYGDLPSDFGF
jgi:hypothetical protein